MGAFYAAGYTPLETLFIIKKHNFFGLTKILWRKSGILTMEKLSDVYKNYFPENTFEALHKKLFITATDILKAESVCFSSGNLSSPIIASSSIPVIFEPLKYEEHLLVDGGLLNNFPVEPLTGVCETIIGVHVNPIDTTIREIHIKNILDRSFHLALSNSVRSKMNNCSIFIEPPELHKFGMFDLKEADQLFQIGYEYTHKQAELIQRVCS